MLALCTASKVIFWFQFGEAIFFSFVQNVYKGTIEFHPGWTRIRYDTGGTKARVSLVEI